MGERLNVNIQKKIGKKLLSKKSCLKKSISHYFSSQLFFPSYPTSLWSRAKQTLQGCHLAFLKMFTRSRMVGPLGPWWFLLILKNTFFEILQFEWIFSEIYHGKFGILSYFFGIYPIWNRLESNLAYNHLIFWPGNPETLAE